MNENIIADTLEDLRNKIEYLAQLIECHFANGHKELRTKWVLDQIRDLQERK